MNRNITSLYIGLAWALLILGGIVAVWFLVLCNANYSIGYDFNFEETGQFGDYIGGVVGTVFALAGTILVFASFVQQQHRNTIESFEKNYFEMLRVHEDIVREMSYNGKHSREIFTIALDQLRRIYNSAESSLTNIKVKAAANQLRAEGANDEDIYNFLENGDTKVVAIMISVGVLYYGKNDFYLSSDNDKVLNAISKLVIAEQPDYGFEPMDNVLGHYYRQMYHTVKYVLKSTWLKEGERYDYVKLLRAQLSDYEQIMLFYNAFSVSGYAWRASKSRNKIPEMSLIARFRLIKNIPYHYPYFFHHPGELFKEENDVWKSKGKMFFENEIYTM